MKRFICCLIAAALCLNLCGCTLFRVDVGKGGKNDTKGLKQEQKKQGKQLEKLQEQQKEQEKVIEKQQEEIKELKPEPAK